MAAASRRYFAGTMSSSGELPLPVTASCRHSEAWTLLVTKASVLAAVLNLIMLSVYQTVAFPSILRYSVRRGDMGDDPRILNMTKPSEAVGRVVNRACRFLSLEMDLALGVPVGKCVCPRCGGPAALTHGFSVCGQCELFYDKLENEEVGP